MPIGGRNGLPLVSDLAKSFTEIVWLIFDVFYRPQKVQTPHRLLLFENSSVLLFFCSSFTNFVADFMKKMTKLQILRLIWG